MSDTEETRTVHGWAWGPLRADFFAHMSIHDGETIVAVTQPNVTWRLVGNEWTPVTPPDGNTPVTVTLRKLPPPATPEIQPALDAEGWEHKEMASGDRDTLFAYVKREGHGREEIANGTLLVGWNAHPMRPVEPSGRHALAALCLHEQAFGFTQKDVARLHYASTAIECESASDPAIAALRSLASRIAALLPPSPHEDG